MPRQEMSRRALLKGGGAAIAGLGAAQVAGPARAFPGHDEEVIPWLDVPPAAPPEVADIIPRQLDWEALDSWLTPDRQVLLRPALRPAGPRRGDWRLEIDGLVAQPAALTLADLQARPRQEVDLHAGVLRQPRPPFVTGGVGNARWAGTPLAPLLAEAGLLDCGTEVVFWGATRAGDSRNSGTRATVGGTGGDLRSPSSSRAACRWRDALDADSCSCYEMNGAPLPPQHGFPVRLIAPGWYGVANVKWLTRIEVLDQRYAGPLHGARLRDQPRGAARRPDDLALHLGRARAAEVGPGQGHAPRRPVPDRGRGLGGADRAGGGAGRRRAVAGGDDRGDHRRSRRSHSRDRFAWTFWTLAGPPAPASTDHVAGHRHLGASSRRRTTRLATKKTFWESNGQITRRVRIPQ